MSVLTHIPDQAAKLSRSILKYRWALAILMGVIAIGFEASEHLIAGEHFDSHFVREVIVFGITFPFLVGFALTLLARTESERLRVVRHLDLEHDLNKSLSQAQDWQSLTQTLVHFPRQVALFTAVNLLLYYNKDNKLESVAQWRQKGSTFPNAPPAPFQANHCPCIENRSWHELDPRFYPGSELPSDVNGYCLPLINGNQPIAMLHLFMPTVYNLSPDQITLLNNVAPSMAFAIDSLHPLGAGIVRAEATEAERRRIARHLHDTLGQNLGYLTLKLDHLRGDDVLQEVAAVRQELAQMHNVANQAYEQVRATLTDLRPIGVQDLKTAVSEIATTISRRGQFSTTVTETGRPPSLPEQTHHQVVGIIREALQNVAKHANADQVTINLNWTKTNLTLTLTDDGHGFDPQSLAKNKRHYGITIMQERARELNGRLTIDSTTGVGTQITLTIPLPTPQQ